MNILIVGNGGREHTIAWKIFNSLSFKESNSKLFCTTGNPGINEIAEPIGIKPDEIDLLLKFAKDNNVDFTVVGPEVPLSLGIADVFKGNGLTIFGPSRLASEIETSKVFSKDFMARNNIPTAKYRVFDDNNYPEVQEYLSNVIFPIVIKADGLAAGKGVYIARDIQDSMTFINDIHNNLIFGTSGLRFVIEEYLTGFEVSVFVITDGTDFKILPFAQDFKKIGEGDTGKNTGGMGSFAPANFLVNDETYDKITKRVIIPTLNNMRKEGREFKGCLYCGLMIVKENDGYQTYVIEFNCRFGDPETQSVLPLIKSDFLQLLIASSGDKINQYNLEVNDLYSLCVVAASGGYPDKHTTGYVVEGLDKAGTECLVFHSGTKESDNNVVTNGGRVLSVVGVSDLSFKDARDKVYSNIEKITFENMYFRKDIGGKLAL
ncbi:MAG: phosphoribosylamine--glycine ligase [Ignavibacteriota bacterium]|nr:phosphoribosylamine--glycine ligase [Ignavibacteriota bacterium]